MEILSSKDFSPFKMPKCVILGRYHGKTFNLVELGQIYYKYILLIETALQIL